MGKIINRVRERQRTANASQLHALQMEVHEHLAKIRREQLMREANIASWTNLGAGGRPTATPACAPLPTEPPAA